MRCVPMVVSILSRAEFKSDDHRDDARTLSTPDPVQYNLYNIFQDKHMISRKCIRLRFDII